MCIPEYCFINTKEGIGTQICVSSKSLVWPKLNIKIEVVNQDISSFRFGKIREVLVINELEFQWLSVQYQIACRDVNWVFLACNRILNTALAICKLLCSVVLNRIVTI